MRIGILSQWYDPEPGPAQLPGALARELASRGHQVDVLTGFPNYPSGEIAEGYRQSWNHVEAKDGVRVHRTPLYASHGSSPIGRSINYGSFGLSAAIAARSAFDDVDALWVSNSPPTVALPMWRTIRRRRAPVLLHILDLWPDNVISSGLLTSSSAARGVAKVIHRWNDRMYLSADHIAGISPGIVETIADRGVARDKLSYIPMWANEHDFYPGAEATERQERNVPDDEVVVLYAGTIGRTQSIDSLVVAVNHYPVDAPRLHLWIAGSGVEEQEIKALAAKSARENVSISFLGRVPGDRMAGLMASADLHFVGLRDDANSQITMPSKMQATLATGRAVLIATGGDAENVIVAGECGIAAKPGDPASIGAALQTGACLGRPGLARLGANAREAYQSQFSLAAGTTRVESLLEQLTRRGDR